MPPIDRFWEMTRHFFDERIKGHSEKAAFAAGMGLLAIGTGIYPALAGVAVTMVVASTALGLFDSFKRGHGKITYEMLLDAQANLIEPTSSASASKKANSYLNFYEMLDRFSQSNTITYEYLEMMVKFRDRARAALTHEQIPYAGTTEPLFGHLYGTPLYTSVTSSEIRIKEWAPEVATTYYNAAMSERLSNNLSESIYNLHMLKIARLALDIVEPDGPAEYQEKEARLKSLLEKVTTLKNEHKNGVSLDDFRLDIKDKYQRTEWLPRIAANTLYEDIEHEMEMLTPKPRVTQSFKPWKPDRNEIAAAVLNARDEVRVQWEKNGMRLETTSDGEFKTSEEILAGNKKLYDVLRHAYEEPRYGPSDLASLEIIHNFSTNIKHSLQYVEISNPIHEKLTQLGLAAEDFRKSSLAAIADDLRNKLYEIELQPHHRSDNFLQYAETFSRYCVLCDHLDNQYYLGCAQTRLSDLSTTLKGIEITGLDTKTLGHWTVENAEKLIQETQPVVDQVLNRLNVNIAARKERQNAELATESPIPGSMNN